MLRSIAIVNRGEAARRLIRAVRERDLELGRKTELVGLVTPPDAGAPFAREVDRVVTLRVPAGKAASAAYLDGPGLIAAIRAAGCDAVWVGWGFVAEDAGFAARVREAQLTFIGPSPEAMRRLGDKIEAKRLAEELGIPVVPWSREPLASAAEACALATHIGFPLALKAAAGGGGRGIRIVEEPGELVRAFEAASGEAARAFGDGRLFVERCISAARHLEVQIVADRGGHVVAFGVRDCTVQRRHQKLVEECPGPALTPELSAELEAHARRLAAAAAYESLGTVEFIHDRQTGRTYFMEMNTRIQVEHPVTELVFGVDLVKLQLDVAEGRSLAGLVPVARGAAVEVRLNAEDPDRDFAPSPGRVSRFSPALGSGLRVDTGVADGTTIPPDFDSMVAKLIAYGRDRAEAVARLRRALGETAILIEGGATNKTLLLQILQHPDFVTGDITTRWLDARRAAGDFEERPLAAEAAAAAAVLSYRSEAERALDEFFAAAARGVPQSLPEAQHRELRLNARGAAFELLTACVAERRYRVELGGRSCEIEVAEEGPAEARLVFGGGGGGRAHLVRYQLEAHEVRVEIDGVGHAFARDAGGAVRAPSPGLVVDVAVREGDRVEAGQRLISLEAMKTEMAVRAPEAGTVTRLHAARGSHVTAGAPLVTLERGGVAASAPSAALPESSDGFLELFGPDGAPRWERLGAPEHAGEAARAIAAELLAQLLGYDLVPRRGELLVTLLADEARWAGLPTAAAYLPLAGAVAAFADLERVLSAAPLAPHAGSQALTMNMAFWELAHRLERGADGAHPELLPALRTALSHYGVTSLEPGPRLRHTLARIAVAVGRGEATARRRHRLVATLVRALAALHRAGAPLANLPELEAALAAVPLVANRRLPFLADNAYDTRHVIFDPAGGAALDADERAPFEDDAALAARLELHRLDAFALSFAARRGDVVAFVGRAKDSPEDERLFVLGEVGGEEPLRADAPSRHLFEHAFFDAVRLLRSEQARRGEGRRCTTSRIHLYLRPSLVVSRADLRQVARALWAHADGLGLEAAVVRARLVHPRRPDAGPVETDVCVTNPTGHRVEVRLLPASSAPLAPASSYEVAVRRARALDVLHPYEVIRLMTTSGGDEAGEGALPPGRFVEHELQTLGGRPRAVPTHRPPGQNVCGVVFGIITNFTAKHPEGMERVLCISDPLRGMGSLAEPECARLIAALELAAERKLPLEWLPVSSGARIAMDSGVENLDWTARVLRRIVELTQEGLEINVIVDGVNVGAQSYFDAEATMLMHTRGLLIMTPRGAMVLTGKRALDYSGGVSAEDERGIGGYERIMAPNGQAQVVARDLLHALSLLFEHYRFTYKKPGEDGVRRQPTRDGAARDWLAAPYPTTGEEPFSCVGDVFGPENGDKKRPFAIRALLDAIADADGGCFERFALWRDAESAVVRDCHLGGAAVCLVGIESRPLARASLQPADGPSSFTGGTLFPLSSKKLARALNAASGNRPVVVLANLSGFDGSPESMRRLQLEYGAELGRAVVNFRGPLLFCVVGRYHGGAYVVFSKALNDDLRALAVEGSFASVIGGAPAAAVVFGGQLRADLKRHPRLVAAQDALRAAPSSRRPALREELQRLEAELLADAQAQLARRFDGVHSVERARQVGALDEVLPAAALRARLVELLSPEKARRHTASTQGTTAAAVSAALAWSS